MKVTSTYLYSAFKKYNEMFFDGKLPHIEIKITNTKSRLGCFKARRCGICWIDISRYDNARTQCGIDHTLIHEMVHFWQHLNFGKSDHLRTFKAKSKDIEIKSNGEFIITRLSPLRLENGITDDDVSPIKPFPVLLVYDKKRGDYWVLSSSGTNIKALYNHYYWKPDLWEVKKYWYSMDRELSTLPKNRTTRIIRGRKIDVKKALEYLENTK